LKKNTGFGFFRLYEKNVAPVARTVSRHGRNLETIPHNHKDPGIKNNLVPI
jgi:hypothetical protein